MLYLLHPHHPLRVSTGTGTGLGSVGRSAAGASGYQHLDWHPTDDGLDAVLVRLALRHGHACRDGIVVHHEYVVLRNRAARWDNTPGTPGGPDGPAGPAGPAERDTPGDLDSAAPRGREEPPAELGQAYRDLVLRFDAQVERDRHAMRELARRRLDDALAAPPVRALVAHWQRLGTCPDLGAAHTGTDSPQPAQEP